MSQFNLFSVGAKLLKPSLVESDGSIVEVYDSNDVSVLSNWGRNINFKPSFIFIPKTKQGACEVVKWADKNDLRIRVSSYRHTWNNVYSNDGDVLISFLSLRHVNSDFSATIDVYGTGAGEEFRVIKFVPGCQENDHIFCKVGSAVTNDEFRKFCDETKDPFANNKWTMPYNVILVENTVAGTVSSICHGAGSATRTVSDLVIEIEFINANGQLQTLSSISGISNNSLMKSAAGSFGLLGVLTSITLKLDKMSFAAMDPQIVDVLHAVPPPKGTILSTLPANLYNKFKNQNDLDAFIQNESQKFYDICQNYYYAEWFWFIFDDNCWVNAWKKDKEENYEKNEKNWENKLCKDYDGFQRATDTIIREFANVFDRENPIFHVLDSYYFTRFMSNIIINQLQLSVANNSIPLTEALHFQRSIRLVHCRDVEIEIGVPMIDGKPDWNICQKAWWDALGIIYKIYAIDKSIPINLALEMRITGGSDVTLAAQNGNAYTCSIEVLSNLRVPKEKWKPAVEQIIAKWISYTDNLGRPLNIRTHWAKQWDGLQFGLSDSRKFVKNSYSTKIPSFLNDLSEIAKLGGYTLDKMQKMFSNNLWDDVIYNKIQIK